MRVVLDTNVLIAAFIARGICTDVFERVISDHELILSSYILDEFQHVMTVKLEFNLERVERAVTLLRRKGCIIEPDRLETPVCRDEDDDPILALARSSEAACLVTGDEHTDHHSKDVSDLRASARRRLRDHHSGTLALFLPVNAGKSRRIG